MTVSDTTTNTRGDYREQWDHITWHILVVSTKDYVVFIDSEYDLDWETTPQYDEKIKADPGYDLTAHNSNLNDAALLEATPCGFTHSVRLQFKRLIGEALSCSLDHDYSGARKMLLAAGQYLRARSEETSRYWYLSASFSMAVLFMIFGCVIWIWRDNFSSTLGSTGLWLALAAAAGAVGALLSVIGRSGTIKFDCAAGRHLHYLEGASRIWAGALSGVLAALAVRTEIILTALTHNGRMNNVMIIAAFAAGATERLASSIISKLESPEVRGRDRPIDSAKRK